MSRIAIISDVHVGNHKAHGGKIAAGVNARCWLALNALRDAIDYAKNEGCSSLVITGDLIDYSRPEAQILSVLQEILGAARDDGLPTILIVGDHEFVSTAHGDHALGPLEPVATIIASPQVVEIDGTINLVCIPYAPDPAVERIPRVMDALLGSGSHGQKRKRVLVLHSGITNNESPPWLRAKSSSLPIDFVERIVDQWSLELVVAGDFHKRRDWSSDGRMIYQVGALVPTGWDNPGLEDYGSLFIYDSSSENVTMREVLGPRFVFSHMDNAKLLSAARAYKGQVFLRLQASSDRMTEALGFRGELLDDVVVAVDIVPDRNEAEACARTAAMATRSQQTLDDALAAYVSEMKLDEGVDRDAVLNRAREYLARKS